MSEEGYSAGAINCARCALSILLPRSDIGQTMGARYWVGRAVKAAWLQNPGGPKYSKFWDVGKVFRCLKTWGKNEQMTLERLGKKLLMLILLVTGQRGQVALALDIDQVEQVDDGTVTFVLTEFMKTARSGDRLEKLILKPYHKIPRLCVVRTLREYLNRTELLRQSDDDEDAEYKLLFLSFKSPYEPVSRDTISRWVLFVLRESGVVGKYGAHSTRGAGVSAGSKLGVGVDVLLKYGSWKSEKTMATHYRKPVESEPDTDLGTVLLDNYG